MVEPLDTRTLLVVAATVTVVLVAGQALQWRSHREVPGTGHWATMNACLFVGFGLLAARGVVPDWLSIVAANLILLTGVGVGFEGVRLFCGRPSGKLARQSGLLTLAAMAVALFWLTYVAPSYHARVVMMSLGAGLGLGAMAWTLVRFAPPGVRAVSTVPAVAAATLSVVLLLRGVRYATAANASEGILASTEWQSVTWLVVVLGGIAWTMGLLLLVSRRVVLELHETQRVLEHLAGTDPLTDILNRRAFAERAEHELQRARRYGTALSMVVFDVDHFKQINDAHGHATGDEVLEAVVARCAAQLREQDLFGRLGGEEFGILTPQVGAEGARALAQRLCDVLANTPFATRSSGELAVSASFGVSTLSASRNTIDALWRFADEALYRAKAAGRGRVEMDGGAEGDEHRSPAEAPVRRAVR